MGLPVSINVGIPGPQVRSRCQHPELLEDVLNGTIDPGRVLGPRTIGSWREEGIG